MRSSRFLSSWDLFAALAVAVAGAVAAQALPAGSVPRVVLTLSALFLAPGYLLVQASLRQVSDTRRRGRDLLLALGVSVPIVGLLALLGAVWPNGFGAGGFALGLLLGCFALAGVAFVRRSLVPVPPLVAMTQPARTYE